METWVPVAGFENLYEVSSEGRIRSIKRNGLVIKPFDNGKGYLMICLSSGACKKKMLVHRIVATAFVSGGRPWMQVNHKNGKKSENRKSNLEWVTASENLKHSYRELGRKPTKNTGLFMGKDNHWSKPVIAISPSGHSQKFESGMQAARELGLKKSSISACCRGVVKTTGGYKFKFDS